VIMKEILVLVEHRKGEVRDISTEMLGLANSLAKSHGLGVTVLLMGEKASSFQDMFLNLCDTLLLVKAPAMDNYDAEPYLKVLMDVLKERKPLLTLMGHTAMGMDLAPPLAARTGIPLVTDCLDLDLEGDCLRAERQVYGGKVNAHLKLKPSKQYLATIRPGSFASEARDQKRAEVVELAQPSWENQLRRKFIGYIEPEIEDVDISDADILVSIGRGIGKPENIPIAEAFAEAIGATLSCSRPVADKGWLPKSRQVGTSGKTVRPKVYIALGISGAFQHQAGMKNSGTIIAVNKDPKAPIFKVAHYGIVGDIFQVLPMLTEKFKERPSSAVDGGEVVT